jgi:hypothetical protein
MGIKCIECAPEAFEGVATSFRGTIPCPECAEKDAELKHLRAVANEMNLVERMVFGRYPRIPGPIHTISEMIKELKRLREATDWIMDQIKDDPDSDSNGMAEYWTTELGRRMGKEER